MPHKIPPPQSPPPLKSVKSRPLPLAVLVAAAVIVLLIICLLAYYLLTSENRESEPASESPPVNRPDEKNNLPDQQEGQLNQQSRNGSTNQLSQSKSEGQSTRENRDLQSPGEALEKALELIEAAKAGKAQGQPGAAVQKALAAWEILNQHPQDSECKALADQLKIEIQDLAEQANAQHKSEIRNDTKKLITN